MDFDGTLSWLSWVCAIFLFSYGFFQRTSTSAYYSDLETEFSLDGAGVGAMLGECNGMLVQGPRQTLHGGWNAGKLG